MPAPMAKGFRSPFRGRNGKVTPELHAEIDGPFAVHVCDRIATLALHVCSLDFSGVVAIDLFGAPVLARALKALRPPPSRETPRDLLPSGGGP